MSTTYDDASYCTCNAHGMSPDIPTCGRCGEHGDGVCGECEAAEHTCEWGVAWQSDGPIGEYRSDDTDCPFCGPPNESQRDPWQESTFPKREGRA